VALSDGARVADHHGHPRAIGEGHGPAEVARGWTW